MNEIEVLSAEQAAERIFANISGNFSSDSTAQMTTTQAGRISPVNLGIMLLSSIYGMKKDFEEVPLEAGVSTARKVDNHLYCQVDRITLDLGNFLIYDDVNDNEPIPVLRQLGDMARGRYL